VPQCLCASHDTIIAPRRVLAGDPIRDCENAGAADLRVKISLPFAFLGHDTRPIAWSSERFGDQWIARGTTIMNFIVHTNDFDHGTIIAIINADDRSILSRDCPHRASSLFASRRMKSQ
jgi:hypothetical protein